MAEEKHWLVCWESSGIKGWQAMENIQAASDLYNGLERCGFDVTITAVFVSTAFDIHPTFKVNRENQKNA